MYRVLDNEIREHKEHIGCNYRKICSNTDYMLVCYIVREIIFLNIFLKYVQSILSEYLINKYIKRLLTV